MKLIKFIMPFIFIVLCTQASWAVNASDVAVIDMSVALCLHPKMALFDFNRIGFYKIELGLKEEEFRRKAYELRSSGPNNEKDINELENKLYEISGTRNDLYARLNESESDEKAKYETTIKELDKKEKEILTKIVALKHQSENFDLTSLEETKEIAAQIEKEIFEAIEEVVRENNYSVVLNSTNFCPYTYNINYESGGIYGQGIPGINFMLFYSFLAKNNLTNPWDETPPSRDVINWMELTKYPTAINLLPMRPYPLVLSGGKSILSDVLRKVYNKYNVDSSVYQVVESVIIKMEQLQYGQKVEQKLRKFDF